VAKAGPNIATAARLPSSSSHLHSPIITPSTSSSSSLESSSKSSSSSESSSSLLSPVSSASSHRSLPSHKFWELNFQVALQAHCTGGDTTQEYAHVDAEALIWGLEKNTANPRNKKWREPLGLEILEAYLSYYPDAKRRFLHFSAQGGEMVDSESDSDSDSDSDVQM